MEKGKFDGLLRVAVGFPVIALALCAALLLWEIQSLRTSLAWLDHARIQGRRRSWPPASETGLRRFRTHRGIALLAGQHL